VTAAMGPTVSGRNSVVRLREQRFAQDLPTRSATREWSHVLR